MALDVTSCRSEREKLQWAFRLYDVDDSGSINLKEITTIMETLDQVSIIPSCAALCRKKRKTVISSTPE